MPLNNKTIVIFIALITAFQLTQIVIAQETQKFHSAFKFDEATRIRSDMGENPFLDYAVNSVKTDYPEAKLAIMSYGPYGLALRRMSAAKKYITGPPLGIQENNVITIYGGYENGSVYLPLDWRSGLKFEMWIVPKGAEMPHIEPQYPQEAYLVDKYGFFCDPCSFEEEQALNTFAEILNTNPEFRGYLIYERDKSFDHHVSSKRDNSFIKNIKKDFVKRYKIDSQRVGTAVNNHSGIEGVSLWIVPKGAKPLEFKTTSSNEGTSKKGLTN